MLFSKGKRSRLWFNDGSCLRLKPLFRNHVWSYDFVADRTYEGRSFRILTLIDEYTKECLALKVRRHFKARDVVEVLSELFLKRGLPCHIRSDNGSEFTAKVVRRWLEKFEIKIYSLNQAAHGRTATMNHSMESSETNYSMVKSLTT